MADYKKSTALLDFSIRVAEWPDENTSLVNLLETSFPNTFEGRTFFKQRPHRRLLAYRKNCLVGHVGLDFRAIVVANQLYDIMGIIDLCVSPQNRGIGIGTKLLNEAEKYAIGQDFSVLFADNPALYSKSNYKKVAPAMTRWFAIDGLQSHSVMERDMSGCFMVKPLQEKEWPAGKIDLLGYLF